MWLGYCIAVAMAQAAALIRPLAWELPYNAGAASLQKKKEKKKEKKRNKKGIEDLILKIVLIRIYRKMNLTMAIKNVKQYLTGFEVLFL